MYRMAAALLLSLSALVACTAPSKETERSKYSVTLPAGSDPVMGPGGGSMSLSFTASDAWTAQIINTRADDWLTIGPTSGPGGAANINIDVKANQTPDERSATVQIKCGTATGNIVVTQKQRDCFTASAERNEFTAEGGTFEVVVSANVSGISYSVTSSGWVKYAGTKAMNSHTYLFSVAPNEDLARREATVKFSCSAGSELFTVYQAGVAPTLVLSQDSYPSVSDKGETLRVDVVSNVSVNVAFSDGCDWITENKTRAMSTSTYYFNVAPNETYDSRSALIRFYNNASGLSETVSVTQIQRDAIVVGDSTFGVPSTGGTFDISVRHNVDYQAETDCDWIVQNKTRAMVEDRLSFSVAENTSGAPRVGHIVFRSGELSQTVSVSQSFNDPSSEESVVGVFGVAGIGWEYRDNTDQTVFRSVEGDCLSSYIMFNPSTRAIFMMKGLPASLAVGDSFTVDITQTVDLSALISRQLPLTVTRVLEGRVWLRDSEEHYIVMQI